MRRMGISARCCSWRRSLTSSLPRISLFVFSLLQSWSRWSWTDEEEKHLLLQWPFLTLSFYSPFHNISSFFFLASFPTFNLRSAFYIPHCKVPHDFDWLLLPIQNSSHLLALSRHHSSSAWENKRDIGRKRDISDVSVVFQCHPVLLLHLNKCFS